MEGKRENSEAVSQSEASGRCVMADAVNSNESKVRKMRKGQKPNST